MEDANVRQVTPQVLALRAAAKKIAAGTATDKHAFIVADAAEQMLAQATVLDNTIARTGVLVARLKRVHDVLLELGAPDPESAYYADSVVRRVWAAYDSGPHLDAEALDELVAQLYRERFPESDYIGDEMGPGNSVANEAGPSGSRQT